MVTVEGSDGGRELAPGALAHPIVYPRPTLCARARSLSLENRGWNGVYVGVGVPAARTHIRGDMNGWGAHTLKRVRTNLHSHTHTHRRVPPHVYTTRSVSERVGSRDVGGLLKFL